MPKRISLHCPLQTPWTCFADRWNGKRNAFTVIPSSSSSERPSERKGNYKGDFVHSPSVRPSRKYLRRAHIDLIKAVKSERGCGISSFLPIRELFSRTL